MLAISKHSWQITKICSKASTLNHCAVTGGHTQILFYQKGFKIRTKRRIEEIWLSRRRVCKRRGVVQSNFTAVFFALKVLFPMAISSLYWGGPSCLIGSQKPSSRLSKRDETSWSQRSRFLIWSSFPITCPIQQNWPTLCATACCCCTAHKSQKSSVLLFWLTCYHKNTLCHGMVTTSKESTIKRVSWFFQKHLSTPWNENSIRMIELLAKVQQFL